MREMSYWRWLIILFILLCDGNLIYAQIVDLKCSTSFNLWSDYSIDSILSVGIMKGVGKKVILTGEMERYDVMDYDSTPVVNNHTSLYLGVGKDITSIASRNRAILMIGPVFDYNSTYGGLNSGAYLRFSSVFLIKITNGSSLILELGTDTFYIWFARAGIAIGTL